MKLLRELSPSQGAQYLFLSFRQEEFSETQTAYIPLDKGSGLDTASVSALNEGDADQTSP